MSEFMLGCLSALVIIFIIAMVVGMVYVLVKIKKLLDDINSLYNDLDDVRKYIDTDIGNCLHRRIDNEVEYIKSSIDSRINKLENKIKS